METNSNNANHSNQAFNYNNMQVSQQMKQRFFKETSNQLDLIRKRKKEEKQKQIEEEKEFLRKSEELYAFGRGKGGGGEPIKNSEGNAVVGRKKTIITEYLEPKIKNCRQEIYYNPKPTPITQINEDTTNNNNLNNSVEQPLIPYFQPTNTNNVRYEQQPTPRPMRYNNNPCSYICHNCGFSPNGNHMCISCLRKKQIPSSPLKIKVITPKPIQIPVHIPQQQPPPPQPQPQPQPIIIDKTNDNLNTLALKHQHQLNELECNINELRNKMESYQRNILNELNLLNKQTMESNYHRYTALSDLQNIKAELRAKSENDKKQMKYLENLMNAGKEIINNQKRKVHLYDYMKQPVITNNSHSMVNDERSYVQSNDDKHQIIMNEMNSWETLAHDRNNLFKERNDCCAYGKHCSKSCKNLITDIMHEYDIKKKYDRAKRRLLILNNLENKSKSFRQNIDTNSSINISNY